MQHKNYDEACNAYDNGYYKDKLEEGLEFQDYITRLLYMHGLVIVGYSSRKYQIEKGENILGAEIKRDNNFRDTGNLYIEVAEKAHPKHKQYVPSGIYREDNGWIFVIGDEHEIWIFQTRILRGLASAEKYKIRQTPTSRGMLLPIESADKYCGKKIIKLQGA